MWVQRILVLLLLQRVLGHTLSRYEPQESEVYELKTDKDTNTVQFEFPKSSVPKLREIIYYHIIEKPYDNPSEEITNEVAPEADTERPQTNTHGYQFLDNLLVDYDTATKSATNPPEEQDYVYDEEGYIYLPPPADGVQDEENPAETYIAAEELAENPEQEGNDEVDDTEVEETVDPEVTEPKEEPSSDDISDNVEGLTTDDIDANLDLTETESDLTKPDAVDDITAETEDNTADVAMETTESMTDAVLDVNEEDALEADEIVKKLEARNQLFGSPEQMRERLLKIRSYLPHLHPMNSQFEPEVVSSKRRRRRRSVNTKRNARRRREILYIYPQADSQLQSRSLIEPYDESEIPEAPTLPPMDTSVLPDYIRSELRPEDVGSDAETPTAEEGFIPPANTYGVKLDNGNGYVWNTLYGSASSEPSNVAEQEYSTPYPEQITEETPDISELEELPAEEPVDGEIPEENVAEEEPMDTEGFPSEIPEETDVGEEVGGDESTGYEDQQPKDFNDAEPEESYQEAEELPAYEPPEELPGDDDNVEESLPEVIEEVTAFPYSDYETTEYTQDYMKPKFLDDIFDSIRDIEKLVDPAQFDDAIIESKIHEYLEAEKDLLHEPVVVEDKEIEAEVDEQAADEDEPAVKDDLIEEEQQEAFFGDNDDEGLAPEHTDSEEAVVPVQHGTYGFHLVGAEGDVWNDLTGVRYHVGNDEAIFDNFENLEPGFNNDINKPDDNADTTLESFNDITDNDPELDNSDKTTDDKINLRIANDDSEKMSSKNDIADIFGNIFKDLKTQVTEQRTNQVTTALPDFSESLESSPFLALLEDDKYRDWVREWTIEYTRFLAEYINDTVQAAIAQKELELLKEEGPIEDISKARLYLNDEELNKSPEVDAIINTISDKYLRRRRKHCRRHCKPESTELAAEDINGASDDSNNDKVVNVFIFFTEEQGEKILDLIKPDANDEGSEDEYVDSSDDEYKPDESELAEPTESPIDEDDFEHVDEATEPSADDFESDTLPVDNPEVVEEPEIVEEPVDETIPDESDDGEILPEEPITEPEIIEEETGGEIEESTPSDIEEISDEPEEAGDEEPEAITEFPEEVSEVEREDLDSEPEVLEREPENEETPEAEEAVEDAVENAEPVEDAEGDETEPIDEPIEEPVGEEEEVADAEPVEGEVVEEEEEIAEPVVEEEATERAAEEEEEEVAEPVEEEEEIAEPVAEEEATERAAEEEKEAAEPVEEEEEIAEPVAEEEEAPERVAEEEEVAEPVTEEDEVAEPVTEEDEVAEEEAEVEPIVEEEEAIEPVVEEEGVAEPVEEEEEVVEPVAEEEAEAKAVAEEEEAEAEPIEEEEEAIEPVTEEVEAIEPVIEEELVEPVAEEEEVAEPIAEEEDVAEAEPIVEEEATEPVAVEEEAAEPLDEEGTVAEEDEGTDEPEDLQEEEKEVEEEAEESRKKRQVEVDDDDDDDDDDEDSDK